MATYSRILDITRAFGLDEDYAFVIFETYRDHSQQSKDQQWAALRHNLNAVGLKATATAFNIYNQVSARVSTEENNRKFARM